MHIYTASWEHAHTLKDSKPLVRVSRGAPSWWPEEGPAVWAFMPSHAVFVLAKEGGDWKAAYRAQLDQMPLEKVAYLLDRNVPEGGVLCCYEADDHECHRKVLWEFLHEHFGVTGGELESTRVIEKRKQRRLL